ncbi:MAG: MGMT family protein [Candidatus Micrarchaeota archaeon]
MAAKSFRDRVFLLAKQIPAGKVATYKSLAIAAGNPKAGRAVGTIMHYNDRKKTGVPCHRIVKSNGDPGGYLHGRKRKISLLAKEGVFFREGKIDLSGCMHTFR